MLLKRNGTFDGSVLNAFFIDENKIYFIFKSVRRSFANRYQSMQYQFGEKADLVRIACQKIYNTHNTILYNYFLQKKTVKTRFFFSELSLRGFRVVRRSASICGLVYCYKLVRSI